MIVEFNGKPVANRDELIRMVIGTKPGTTVPVKVMRDKKEKTLNVTVEELDLEAESGAARARGQRRRQETSGGFGLTLGNMTPSIARRLRLPSGATGAVVMDVDAGQRGRRAPACAGRRDPEGERHDRDQCGARRAACCRRCRRWPAMLLVKSRQGQQLFLTKKDEAAGQRQRLSRSGHDANASRPIA